MTHDHGPNVSERLWCRLCINERAEPILAQRAGHGPWGTNDGSLRSVLESWRLNPVDFMESLDKWGFTIKVKGER